MRLGSRHSRQTHARWYAYKSRRDILQAIWPAALTWHLKDGKDDTWAPVITSPARADFPGRLSAGKGDEVECPFSSSIADAAGIHLNNIQKRCLQEPQTSLLLGTYIHGTSIQIHLFDPTPTFIQHNTTAKSNTTLNQQVCTSLDDHRHRRASHSDA